MKSLLPVCAYYDEVASRSHMEVEMSDGNAYLTPLAVRYHFTVFLNINGTPPSPDLTESMLRGVIQGQFAREHKLTSWEQTHLGFTLEFRPGLVDNSGAHNRRYFKGVNLYCEYTHPVIGDIDRLFSSIVYLLDLTMTTAINSLHQVVPALFTDYNAVQRVKPLVEALGRAIKIDQIPVWQQTEGQLLGNRRPKSREWNINDPQIIPPVSLSMQNLWVLDDYDTTHSLITLQELCQELQEEVVKKEEIKKEEIKKEEDFGHEASLESSAYKVKNEFETDGEPDGEPYGFPLKSEP